MKLKLAALGFAVVMVAALMGSSKARDFIVGGSSGWVENPSESFEQWARRNRFQLNDSLVFRYKEDDSVLVVGEEDYQACNTTKPQRSFHVGETVFRLTKPGPVYFIGGADGRCEKGQKLVVVVMSEHGGDTAAAPSPGLAPAGGLSATPPSPEGFAAAGGPGEVAPPPVSASSVTSVCMVVVLTVFTGAVAILM